LNHVEKIGILEPMPTVESEAQAARREPDLVLGIAGFVRNEHGVGFAAPIKRDP
jgi:hypothetical protein